MEVPRRTVQFVELGDEITLVSLVCEDLAQIDDVAEVIRSVGPTIVLTPLLDGPQLASRWAARYASVLADDLGAAVLTLTSFGMVQRSRPRGRDSAPVIALWKDPVQGTREIPLEAGAHGVLLTECGDRATRRTADGRWPVDNATHHFDVAVHQVRAANTSSGSVHYPKLAPCVMETDELTILTGWAQGVAEVLGYAPEYVDALLANARRGSPWRVTLALAEPSPRLSEAIDYLAQAVRTAAPAGSAPTLEAVWIAIRENRPGEQGLAGLTRRVLRSTVEQLRIRQASEAR
jgi:hypothetical protein